MPPAERVPIDVDLATRLIQRYLDPGLRAVDVQKLHGGMISRVRVFHTNGEPARLVAKIHVPDQVDAFRHEMANLQFYRQQTDLPVPIPYAVIEPTASEPISGLLLEYVDAPNLADARISPQGLGRLQRQLAQHVARLHEHHGAHYGSAVAGEHFERWLDVFGPMIRSEYEQTRPQLPSRVRGVADSVLANLERWLPEAGQPTLVHGDLWATNILVDDHHPDDPQVRAFIDCHPSYCDTEYELAYLRLFHTADDRFFDAYSRVHPLRDGFDRRCRVYWLQTMLLHVRLFGDRYLRGCVDVLHQLRQLGA